MIKLCYFLLNNPNGLKQDENQRRKWNFKKQKKTWSWEGSFLKTEKGFFKTEKKNAHIHVS